MKLLVDVGLGKKVDDFLKSSEYDVKCIRDLDPGMLDDKILDIAIAEERIILTLDKDFGELIYSCKRKHAGILLLRLEDERASQKIKVISVILRNYSKEIHGKFSVYQRDQLRIRG